MNKPLAPTLTATSSNTYPFEVGEIESDFVAEITGIDLTAAISKCEQRAIQTLRANYPVLIFPHQALDASSFENFASCLGEIGHDPYLGTKRGHAHVVEVCRRAQETAPIFGASWHSDWSFQREPPATTLLFAKTIPPVGGDTFFANSQLAYDRLPDDLRKAVSGKFAIHTAAPSYGPSGLFAQDDDSRSMRILIDDSAEQRVRHPIVRRHPYNGRAGLFVNHVYTEGVEGLSAEAGRGLLKQLFRHMSYQRFVYRHRWQQNSLVIWDNRSVIHRAAGGYEGYDRVMYRLTLRGEVPLSAFEENS